MNIEYNNKVYRFKDRGYGIYEIVNWNDGYYLTHYAVTNDLTFHKYTCQGNDAYVETDFENEEEKAICMQAYAEWLQETLEKSLLVQDDLLENKNNHIKQIIKFREQMAKNVGWRLWEDAD